MWKQGLRRLKNAFNAANPSAKSHLETRDIEARLHPCIDLTGKHTYGAEHLRIMQWGEGSRLIVGSFN